MFSTPVRRIDAAGNTLYEVKVSMPPMGIKLQVEKSARIVPDVDVQKQFETLRKHVLTELTKEKTLFRNAPSFASLDAITPVWGFLRGLAKDDLSPTTYVNFHTIAESMMPCSPTSASKPRLSLFRTAVRFTSFNTRFRSLSLASGAPISKFSLMLPASTGASCST